MFKHTFEVANFENGRSGFRGGALQFWAVDLEEPVFREILAEKVADSTLQLENGLIGLSLRKGELQ